MSRFRWFRRRKPEVLLRAVYVQADDDSDEPLVAVVWTEPEALALEEQVAARYPGLAVAWEHLTFHASEGHVVEPEDPVHLVLSGSTSDPVGRAAFAEYEQAIALARAEDGVYDDVFVRSVFPYEWLDTDHPLPEGITRIPTGDSDTP